METPWGTLKDLDLANLDLAAKILSADKHQLLEGLIVESLFDQIVENIQMALGPNVITLNNVDSVVVDTKREKERWLVFVWAKEEKEGLGRYLLALQECFIPYLVTYSDGEFMAARVRGRKRVTQPRPMQELMLELSGGKMEPFRVDESVRDHIRQKQAFWGYLLNHYGDSIGDRVVLPRILINCGIQPYFRSIWNLDRILIVNNEVWLFEIKHKFPMDRKILYFGINNGELKILDMLARAGIHCLHTILVKPYWDKSMGSMYLLNNLNIKERIALIATVLDEAKTARFMRQGSGWSGAHTSISGSSGLNFKSMAATDFKVLGLLSDHSKKVAMSMTSVMAGSISGPVSDGWLRDLRVHDVNNIAG